MSKRDKATQETFPRHQLARAAFADLVMVTFLDPTEFDLTFGKLDGPCECVTVGWLLERNNYWIKLGWLYEDSDPDGSVGLILPKGCVLDMERLSLLKLKGSRNVLKQKGGRI